MSAGRKREAVLRLLRGEDLELVSRELGVTAAELSGWREAFLAAGEVSLKSRPGGRPGRRDRPPEGEGGRAGGPRGRRGGPPGGGGGRADHGERAARGQDRPAVGRPPLGPAEVEA